MENAFGVRGGREGGRVRGGGRRLVRGGGSGQYDISLSENREERESTKHRTCICDATTRANRAHAKTGGKQAATKASRKHKHTIPRLPEPRRDHNKENSQPATTARWNCVMQLYHQLNVEMHTVRASYTNHCVPFSRERMRVVGVAEAC